MTERLASRLTKARLAGLTQWWSYNRKGPYSVRKLSPHVGAIIGDNQCGWRSGRCQLLEQNGRHSTAAGHGLQKERHD